MEIWALALPNPVGDLNSDGALDFFDIDPFVVALANPEAYYLLHPDCNRWYADANRDGTVDFFGEYKGAGDETLISDMPENERPWGYGQDWFKSKFVARRTAKSGKLYTLEDPESWHCQRAGPEGAIVAEYATYHTTQQAKRYGQNNFLLREISLVNSVMAVTAKTGQQKQNSLERIPTRSLYH